MDSNRKTGRSSFKNGILRSTGVSLPTHSLGENGAIPLPSKTKKDVEIEKFQRQNSAFSTKLLLNGNPMLHVNRQHSSYENDEAKADSVKLRPLVNSFSLVSSRNSAFFDSNPTESSTSIFSKTNSMNPNVVGRLNSSMSTERALSPTSQLTEETNSFPQFIHHEASNKIQRTVDFILRCQGPRCVSKSYRNHFYDTFHSNYCGESETVGPFIVSARFQRTPKKDSQQYEAQIIARTCKKSLDLMMTMDDNDDNVLLQKLLERAQLTSILKFHTIGDPKAREKIYNFDRTNDERHNCKIGVIYQNSNQLEEQEIFSNENLPDEMTEFLGKIADRVTLKGFEKYRADLDTKNDLHGDHSYHTEFDDREIMFNVAPLIPSSKTDGQFSQRKGLVGNAFVCVVFQEENARFHPESFSGRVTQIYITVQPLKFINESFYKVELWRRCNVSAPIEPNVGIFKGDRTFREYFLTLIVNAVSNAVESPQLRGPVFDSRQRAQGIELKSLIQHLSRSPIPELVAIDEDEMISVDSSISSGRRPSLSNNEILNNFEANLRTSPTPSKKVPFSKRIFGVFSGRSGSTSSWYPNNSTLTVENPEMRQRDSTKSKNSQHRHSSLIKTPVMSHHSGSISLHRSSCTSPINDPSNSTISSPPSNDRQEFSSDFLPRNRSNSSPEDQIRLKTSAFTDVLLTIREI